MKRVMGFGGSVRTVIRGKELVLSRWIMGDQRLRSKANKRCRFILMGVDRDS